MWWWLSRSRERDQEAKSEESEAAEPTQHHSAASRIVDLQQAVGNQSVQRMISDSPPGASKTLTTQSSGVGGEPLPQETREVMEARFGADFGDVRVHADDGAAESAAALDASAYTAGRDIYFAPGAYAPATLAHELTHVIQQGRATSSAPGEEASLEREADLASRAVMSGRPAEITGARAAPPVQRQATPGVTRPSLSVLPSESVTLDAFDINGFALSSTHQRQLDALAERLKSTLSSAPDTFVSIIGFADAPGTEPHNLRLGQQRAESVRDYLVAIGLPGNLLHASSLGEQLPSVETKRYEPKNRRVEINIHERSFFKPSLTLPPTPLPTPPVAPPKIDLTYKPEIHIPTPKEEIEENFRRNEEISKQAQEILEREKARAGTSVSDVFGHTARELAKKLGLPKWVQDRAESLGEGLPSKGAQVIFDQITGDKNLDQGTKNALTTLIAALMKTKVK